MRLDTGKLISDLRDGTTTGTVSSADIKKAMKEEKAQKADLKKQPKQANQTSSPSNEKPTKAASIPSPSPVKATPTQVPAASPQAKAATVADLIGCSIQADRSIVDKSGKKVASLKGSGAIVDVNSNEIAKINLESGTVVDARGVTVGIVRGDGTISSV